MERKPDKEILIETLTEMVQKHPPTFLYNSTMAFKMLLDRYPEIVSYIEQYPDTILYREFELIYTPGRTPSQMADELLKPRLKERRERERERGFSKKNKTLLSVDNILNNPEAVVKTYRVNINGQTFYRLLRTANNLRTHGKSLDEYFTDCSDKERTCIAESLGSLYLTNILFRTELYKKYHEKTKTIKKMPETEEYYIDAYKLAETKGGKQVTKANIEQDIQEFRNYLLNKDTTKYLDREFYDRVRFRYLAYLVTRISKVLKNTSTKINHKKAGNNDVGLRFSIDHYLDELMWQPRSSYGIVVITLPAFHCEGQAITQ